MTNFILRRLGVAVLLLFLISLISFFIVTLTPGSPYPWGELNPKISEEVKANFRAKFHLDKPLPQQYAFIMRDLFNGDLRSIKDDRPVLQKIGERLPATISLNLFSLALSLSFGLWLGIFAARHYGRLPDLLTSILAFSSPCRDSGFPTSQSLVWLMFSALRFWVCKLMASPSRTHGLPGWIVSGIWPCRARF
jgi:peptide/nickel transport system permease protein